MPVDRILVPVEMEKVDLNRYEAGGILGSGADYEVRMALDTESGKQVVLKRPLPQMVSRQLHGGTEARTDMTLQVYQEVAHQIPMVVPILGYTDRAVHDSYFGDSLGQEYRVTIEERAAGIPLLVADPRARITGVPVGVGQNLFALFPWLRPDPPADLPFHQQLLDVEETFYCAGYLLLDLRPQNIFYQPDSGRITVIDCGDLLGRNDQTTRGNRAAQDIHDFYLEILKYYTTPQQPPAEAVGYRAPHGIRPVVRFEQELDQLSQSFGAVPSPAREAALNMLNQVRGRSYNEFDDFRRDLSGYLDIIKEQGLNSPYFEHAQLCWLEALDWLRGDHWRRYLFDADTELAQFNV